MIISRIRWTACRSASHAFCSVVRSGKVRECHPRRRSSIVGVLLDVNLVRPPGLAPLAEQDPVELGDGCALIARGMSVAG